MSDEKWLYAAGAADAGHGARAEGPQSVCFNPIPGILLPTLRKPDPSVLPADPKARKEVPLATGCFDYFTDALIAIARLSKKANERHNPGEPLHWSKGKSTDHDDCALRHFAQRGQMDAEWGESHTVEYAWRALARLQMEIEAERAGKTYEQYIKSLQAEKK